MSIEIALQFLDHVGQRPALQARIAAFKGRTAIDGLRAVAAEAGFIFSDEDYRAAITHLAAGELSDEAIREVQRELGVLPD
jgi:predicted ribosomally synthesized peptide with nif11-like leader